MSLRRGARLAALLVPALLLTPVAAHAASLTVDDAAADARAVNMGAVLGELIAGTPAEGPYLLDAPAETSTDVVGTTIDHAAKRLTVTVQFRDLVSTDGHAVELALKTPRLTYALSVTTVGGRTRGDLFPSEGVVVVSSSDGAQPDPAFKPCRTVRARYDLAADSLTASVPTSCLGSPKWVQVGAMAYRTQIAPQADGSANVAGFVDDAFRTDGGLQNPGLSPKVRRG